jgi:hypothetical protein
MIESVSTWTVSQSPGLRSSQEWPANSHPRRQMRYRWLQVPLRVLRQPASRWRREWDELTGTAHREFSDPFGRPSCRGSRSAADRVRAAAAWWKRRAFGRRYIGLTMRYRPRPCAFPLHLLLSETNHRLGLASEWEQFARAGLRIWVAPGTHESYLHDTPERAAQVLNTCLSTVFGGPD